MEILSILVMLFLVAFTVSINPTRVMRAIFCIATFYIGLITVIEGITYGATTLIAVNTPLAYMTMVFMTLGSMVTMYGAALGENKE